MTSALLLCPADNFGLLGSYGRAFRRLNVDVAYFHLSDAIQKHVKFDRIGRAIAKYLPFEPWVVGGNRDLIHQVMALKPDILLFAGAIPIRAGALAQIKAACPTVRVVLAWPDTMLNLSDNILACLPMCDLVASYSSTAIPLLERLGARAVEWFPFAVDEELFPGDTTLTAQEREALASDVVFIGNHREDREAAVSNLVNAGLSVKVWGAGWDRSPRDPVLVGKVHQSNLLIGRELVKAVRAAKVSLNAIDPTNFPAANMRFFEQYACGGVSLSSPCPEMEPEFPDGVCGSYYRSDDELVGKAKELVNNADLRGRLRSEGRRRALRAHTYVNRAEKMLKVLGLRPGAATSGHG